MSTTIEQIWTERGDAAALEDLRAGNGSEWDRNAVLAHLGIFAEDDTDAVSGGLTGADLDAAQRAALSGYERRMAQHAPRFAVAWTERGEPRSFAVDGDEAAAYAARRVFLVGAQRDPSVDPHSVRVVRST